MSLEYTLLSKREYVQRRYGPNVLTRLKKVVKSLTYPLLAILAALFFKKRNKLQIQNIRSVLVVNLGLIGDGLLITPTLSTLTKELNNDAKVAALLSPASSTALRNDNSIEKFIYDAFWADPSMNHRHIPRIKHLILTFRTVRSLRKAQFDVIINPWVSDQPLNCLFLRSLKPKNLVGYSFKYAKYFCDYSLEFDETKHVVDNQQSLLSSYFGEQFRGAFDRSLYYSFPTGADAPGLDAEIVSGPFIMIAPFASQKAKDWDEQSWAWVIEHLLARYPDYKIVLTGTSPSTERAASMIRNFSDKIINTVGNLSFDEYALLISQASLLIVVESVAIHLASVFHVPVFVLYSRVYNYEQFLPINTKYGISVVDVDCAECFYGCHQPICMNHDVSRVIESIDRLIDQAVPRRLDSCQLK
jgi:ADP-heptose:LPS heptosyltransferase